MQRKTLSIWDGVPDAEALKAKLKLARDAAQPEAQRLEAVSFLSGVVKAYAAMGIEKRRPLADYLAAQVRKLRSSIYQGST